MIVSQQIFYTDMKSLCPAEGFCTYSGYCSKDSGMRYYWKFMERKVLEKKNLFLLTW